MSRHEAQCKSTRTRAALTKSGRCGCFYCLAIFDVTRIRAWTDDDLTAICPHCSVDSVIPIDPAWTTEETERFLSGMRRASFG